MNETILAIRLALTAIELLEQLRKPKYTPEQRAAIREARRLVAKAIREQA